MVALMIFILDVPLADFEVRSWCSGPVCLSRLKKDEDFFERGLFLWKLVGSIISRAECKVFDTTSFLASSPLTRGSYNMSYDWVVPYVQNGKTFVSKIICDALVRDFIIFCGET